MAHNPWPGLPHPGAVPLPRRESSVDDMQDPSTVGLSKREKRRLDMCDRVERLQIDTMERKDRIYLELSDIFNRTVDELLPPPVFPTFDLDVPVGQLPPSLPFTDPIIPDMHPTAFLFSLHRLSLQRENELLKSRLMREHQRTIAKKLYEAEVIKIGEEYELAKKSVQESLADVIEEKRRKLWAEKEAEIGPSSTTLGDTQITAPGRARRLRGNQKSRPPPVLQSSALPTPRQELQDTPANSSDSDSPLLPRSAISTAMTSEISTQSQIFSALTTELSDPFSLSLSLLAPSNFTSTSGAGPIATSRTYTTSLGKRKPGQRSVPGLPPAHFSVQSGTYLLGGKSLAGLSGVKTEEGNLDVRECWRGSGSRRGKRKEDSYR